MNVRELIEHLQKFGGEMKVILASEDSELCREDQMIRLFEVQGVESQDCELARGSDGVPSVKFGRSEKSQPACILSITTDF